MTNYHDQIAGPNSLGYQDEIPSFLNGIAAQHPVPDSIVIASTKNITINHTNCTFIEIIEAAAAQGND